MFTSKRENDFTDSEPEVSSEEELEQTEEEEERIHHLAPTWALWLWVGDRSMEWGQCLKKQCDINSIEDFCALKCRILPPSRLPSSPKVSYYVFKSGIKPMWEDEYNQGGGAIHLHIGHQYQLSRLDRYWFELLMAGFGGQFGEHNNKICGFTCRNGQKGYVLSIWVTDVSSVKVYNPIMEIVEAKLGITNNGSVNFSISKHPPPSQYGRSIPVVSGTNAVEQGEE